MHRPAKSQRYRLIRGVGVNQQRQPVVGHLRPRCPTGRHSRRDRCAETTQLTENPTSAGAYFRQQAKARAPRLFGSALLFFVVFTGIFHFGGGHKPWGKATLIAVIAEAAFIVVVSAFVAGLVFLTLKTRSRGKP